MRRLSRAVSHAGRGRESYDFTISDISAAGGILANLYNCNGIIVQLWRNGKTHKTGEAMLVGDGDTAWEGEIRVPCTLYESKGGKGLSSKFFNVSLLVRHGKKMREVARGEVDMAVFVRDAAAATPLVVQASTLVLEPRGDYKGAAKVTLRWTVTPNKAADAADDDAFSRADSTSTLASGTVVSELGTHASDQDLRGFEPALERINSERGGGASDSGAFDSGALPAVAPPVSPGALSRVTEDTEPEASPSPRPREGGESPAASFGGLNAANSEAVASAKGVPPTPPQMEAVASCVVEASAVAAAPVGIAAPPASPMASVSSPAGAAGAPSPVSVKAGWLVKQAVSATMFKNWRKRYVVLSPLDNTVVWKKTPEQTTPQGQLSLVGDALPGVATCEMMRSSEGKLQLHILAGRKELVLMAVEDDEAEMTAWKTAFDGILSQLALQHPTPPEGRAAAKNCVLL